MPEWLTKAQATIAGNRTGADFQPFERHCVCGELLVGERTDRSQKISCPTCERTWFILPRDPYPRPKSRANKPTLWKRLAGGRSPAASSEATEPRGSAATAMQDTATLPSSKTRETPASPTRSPLRTRIENRLKQTAEAAKTRAKRAARPIRLVAVGMTFAVLVTGLWLWHRARVDAASATVVSVTPQAEQALADRNFPKAERLFADVTAAVNTLGANDQTARRVRQRHRELVAINNLAAQTPYDLAAEAEAQSANPNEWSERFRATYAGRWVIFDIPVGSPEVAWSASSPGGDNEATGEETPRRKVVLLDLPLAIGKHAVRFEADAKLFERLQPPTRAIFAAQYSSWQLRQHHKDEPPQWVVRFEPKTAFLWASDDIYAALGFDLDDPAAPPRAALERQSKLLGLAQDDAKSASSERGTRPVKSKKREPSSPELPPNG
jgi:hypothetical protein